MSKKSPTILTENSDGNRNGMIDPSALMRIKSVELRAKVVVEGFWKGIHRSPYHGFSVEFTEYRPYISGDDTRYIDWQLYARSDRLYIKKFEDETNLRCYLLVDHSRSMTYGSGDYSKATYAATLAGTLAYFLSTQGDAVGLATFDEKLDQYFPPRNRPGHLHRLMLMLENEPEGRATDLGPPLKRIAEILTKRGMLVLISDLLAPIDQLEKHLGYLRACGHDVVVFQVMDRAELEFDFQSPALFRDMEDQKNMYIDPELAQSEYLEKLNRHLEAVKSTCQNLGVDYRLTATDKPLELALLDYLVFRMRHKKQSTHKIRMGGGSTT